MYVKTFCCQSLCQLNIPYQVRHLKELWFAQVHRSVVVKLRSIRRLTRSENEAACFELSKK